MLQESFSDLSKEFLDLSVTASLIKADFGEQFDLFGDVEVDLKAAIDFIRKYDYTKLLKF